MMVDHNGRKRRFDDSDSEESVFGHDVKRSLLQEDTGDLLSEARPLPHTQHGSVSQSTLPPVTPPCSPFVNLSLGYFVPVVPPERADADEDGMQLDP